LHRCTEDRFGPDEGGGGHIVEETGTRSGGRQRATLRTVAQATGLAITTVSRALAKDPRIAAQTRELVAEAARAQGYVPDRAAQRLRTGRTKVVQLLLSLDHEFLGFTHDLLGGLTAALQGTGYSVTLFPDVMHADRMTAVRTIVENRLGDGIVFNRTEPFDPRVRYLTEQGFPFVSHGRTEFTTPHPWVDYDNEAFARAAVARLAYKGRSRILMILPQDRFTFAQHLRYGLVAACRERGLTWETPEAVSLSTPATEVAAFLRQRLAAPDAPDGVVCVGEVAAIACLSAMADLHLHPGRQLDVVAKRASAIFDLLRPTVDTVFEDLWEAGRAMGRTLLRSMQGEAADALHVLQAPKIEFKTHP
jgi:LacI family transcriptional regulator